MKEYLRQNSGFLWVIIGGILICTVLSLAFPPPAGQLPFLFLAGLFLMILVLFTKGRALIKTLLLLVIFLLFLLMLILPFWEFGADFYFKQNYTDLEQSIKELKQDNPSGVVNIADLKHSRNSLRKCAIRVRGW